MVHVSLTLAIAIGVAGLVLTRNESVGEVPKPLAASELRPASSFAGIADPRSRSIALFEEAGKVLQSPRCVNCHPATDRPRQTDERRLHIPLVVRGADGHGAPGMRCTTRHHVDNFEPAGIPGNDHWHLAPASMTWEGLSLGQICEQIKDPKRNGGRSLEDLVHHIGTDSLVGWAWAPGSGRTPAPGTQQIAGALADAWVKTGAVCP